MNDNDKRLIECLLEDSKPIPNCMDNADESYISKSDFAERLYKGEKEDVAVSFKSWEDMEIFLKEVTVSGCCDDPFLWTFGKEPINPKETIEYFKKEGYSVKDIKFFNWHIEEGYNQCRMSDGTGLHKGFADSKKQIIYIPK